MTSFVVEQHIVATSGTRSGKPRIDGTRITVADVVIWHFRMGYSLDEIGVKWSLPLAAVYAAISFYYDHQAEIDGQIVEAGAEHARMKEQTPSILQAKLEIFRK